MSLSDGFGISFQQRPGKMTVPPEEAVILIAEDSEDDIALIRLAFQKSKLINPVQFVRNGEEAIAYLKGEGLYANRVEYPLPCLVLLDLKMPRKNGLEVLEWIRGQPGLNALRVVVLTTSQEIRDVNQAYQLGANSFLVKPTDLHDFVAMTRALAGYWLWMSQMPESWRAPRKAVSGGLHPPGSTLSPQAVP
jgi:CheY-like chemotaxis protein